VPTLIRVGELDQTTPLIHSFNLLQLIPGSKMQIFPNAAHITKYEVGEDYNQAVAEFQAPYEPEAALPLLTLL
jgi:pimeloyl-ACP methyl ester carboxylesterase